MSLRSFVQGRGVAAAATSPNDAASTTSALLRSIDRAAGKIDARELGLLGLAEAVAVPRDVEELRVYALTLQASLSVRSRAHWRSTSPSDEPRSRRGRVHAGPGRTIDFLAQIVGLLRAGHAIAIAFTRERVLFRRLLGDAPSSRRARQANHEARIRGVGGAVSCDLVHRRQGSRAASATSRSSASSRRPRPRPSLSEQMQVMGGTGFMKGPGCRGVPRKASLASSSGTAPSSFFRTRTFTPGSAASSPPGWHRARRDEGSELPATSARADLLTLLPRFAAACAEARAPRGSSRRQRATG